MFFSFFVIIKVIAIMILLHKFWVFDQRLKPLSLFQFWLVAIINFIYVLCLQDTVSFTQAYPSRLH
ncbi:MULTISPECIES: hypothetical protein [unclassified Motilimonas]|uniref:hypothetical protein n=1 Tax=Motilimonas TaxID=1914248 RepID=UPI001E3172A2|nr:MULTISPECIES: hypothetical protein [unclassified Motilimonas]MCE0557524.1 hypothetical protein [Motilimonas sp. E26]MDO6524592.1 hypothetical protein [Motilimonas sp. 1_MG-2023]